MSATSAQVPLVVVLDDSYSMLAGDAMSPRALALQALEGELKRGRYKVRFVLAGPRPQLLGEPTTRLTDALRQLEGWTCSWQGSDLDLAVGLAAEVGGKAARILVVTDRGPEQEIPPGPLRWWAFGRGRSNVAFVGAARSAGGPRSRVLLEVANLSDKAGQTRLTLERLADDGATAALADESLNLEAREVRTIFFDLTGSVGPVRARLSSDELPMDNEVILLPPPPRPVKVRVQISDEDLRRLVTQAIEAAGDTMMVTTGADLLITNSTEPISGQPGTWVLRIIADKEAVPYLGPFVIDRSHALGEGLSLEGVIWAAIKAEDETAPSLPGRPVITAGNVVLLSDELRGEHAHDLRLRFRPDLSTLARSPNWPILIWNLVEWRRDFLPGVERTNLRTGEDARIMITGQIQLLQLIEPGGHARPLPIDTGDRMTVPASAPGIYRIRADEREHRFAANVLHRDESDLSAGKAGRWGDWAQSAAFQWEYRSIAWVFTLVAAAILTLHMFLVARLSGKGMRV